MKTIKETLEMALEALEYIHEGANNQGTHTGISWRCVSNKAEPVITDLREALASEAIEQPAQQEPVGCEGAIVNGRFYADRLEHDYKFECEAGPLHLCTDWVEFRRCFEWLAQHTSPPAQRTWVGLTIEDKKEYIAQDFGGSRTDAMDWTEKRLMEKNSD